MHQLTTLGGKRISPGPVIRPDSNPKALIFMEHWL